MQQRKRVGGGSWQHACDAENKCITSCALAPQQQRITPSQNEVKIKGICSDCSGAVTSEQPRTKTSNGTWRHEQDGNGRCMASSHNNLTAMQPVKRMEEPGEVPRTPQMEWKVKHAGTLAPTRAPEARSQILSMLSSPNCVETSAMDFIQMHISSHNREVY
eukprot:1679597-Rhodomonas_salina.4